jgi:phospholipid/cholesterol/gamma-HCH transport system substrate-binding protein
MKTRTEIKVGLFVLVALAFAALVIILFNKSAGPLTPTYDVKLKADNVAGVYLGSSVLMAGVRVGYVKQIELVTSEGTTLITVRLLKKYPIRTNSRFVIRTSGFLGDQYVAVIQGPNTTSEVFQDNAGPVPLEGSFDLGEATKTAAGLLVRVTDMVGQLSNAVQRVDATLLTPQTLNSLTQMVGNLYGVSDRTLSVIGKVEGLLDTNAPPISMAVSNAQGFTIHLNELASELKQTLATNREELTASMKNIEAATAKLNSAVEDVNNGKGLAGTLIKNEQLAADMSLIVSNLQVLSSNINNKGLWSVMRKPKVAASKK